MGDVFLTDLGKGRALFYLSTWGPPSGNATRREQISLLVRIIHLDDMQGPFLGEHKKLRIPFKTS